MIFYEKIISYQLSNKDIEESFFLPLEFNEEATESCNRQYLLKQYIIDWNYYSEDEKKSIISQEKFQKEEVM